MTVADAAKIIGCHEKTIYNYVRSGELKVTRPYSTPNNKIEISQEEIKRFMAIPKGLLTVEEVAEMKGVKTKTVHSWVTRGKLKPKLKFLRQIYFDPEDVWPYLGQ